MPASRRVMRSRASAEALCRSRARGGGDLVAIARRRRRLQRVDQPPRRDRNLFDGAVERVLIRFGWLVEAAQFANELQRRVTDLFVGRRWIKIEQRLDVS